MCSKCILQMSEIGNRISPPPEKLPGNSKLPRRVERLEPENEKSKPIGWMENKEYLICEAVRNRDELSIKRAYLKSLEEIEWHVEKAGGWLKRSKTSKDFAQDAWVILLTKLSTGYDCRLLPDRSFYAFLKKIAYYLFLVSERRVKLDETYLVSLTNEFYEDQDYDIETHEILRKSILEKAMKQLSQEDREILEAHYYESLDHEALSRKLGISGEAVRQRLSRARARLKEILKDKGINGTWI